MREKLSEILSDPVERAKVIKFGIAAIVLIVAMIVGAQLPEDWLAIFISKMTFRG